jgi:hypothetical protein
MGAESELRGRTQASGWAASRRGRKELLAVALFGLASAVVPLLRTELYPFSRVPMFAAAPRCYCGYAVHDPEGRLLPLLEFGLQRNYWGNPVGVGVGFEPPPTLDRFGEVPGREEVTRHVEHHLSRIETLAYVEVVQEVIGPVGQGVGPVATRRWRVSNPRFGREGKE